ncbi:MAG: hypothetical protein ABEJ98_02050 [Candidatus Nanohaloarchaea archaeon]
MKFFGREADFEASWGFSPNLKGLSEKNFNREGSPSFNSGFILDPEVINRKFYGYAATLEEASESMKGKIDYFKPEERDRSLTEVAEEMDEVSTIPHILNGNWDERDEIAEEIITAIEEKPRRREVDSREEIDYLAERYAIVGAELVFEKDSSAASLEFDSASIDSYLAETSETSGEKPFRVKVYGSDDFRRELSQKVPDLAGKWSTWDLARNKVKDTRAVKKLLGR